MGAHALGISIGQMGGSTDDTVGRDGDGDGIHQGGLTVPSPVQRAWISRESAPRPMIGVLGFLIASGKCSLKTAMIFPSCPRTSLFFFMLHVRVSPVFLVPSP